MNGLGVRYLCTRSSRKRSGSNFMAVDYECFQSMQMRDIEKVHTVGTPEVGSAMHVHDSIYATASKLCLKGKTNNWA